VIPFVILGIAAGTSLAGCKAAVDGLGRIKEAEKVVERAKKRLEKAQMEIEEERRELQESLKEYAQAKAELLELYSQIIALMGGESRGAVSRFLEPKLSCGVNLKEPTFKVAQALLEGSFKAVAAGLSGYASTLGLAFAFGTASTGTPIACLAGAAAENAALAWLGGGALSAGGGGMALGSVVLGGATVAPAIFLVGMGIAKEGQRRLKEAREFEMRVLEELKKLAKFRDKLRKKVLDVIGLAKACRIMAGSKEELEELLAGGGVISRVKLELVKFKLFPRLYSSKRLLEAEIF